MLLTNKIIDQEGELVNDKPIKRKRKIKHKIRERAKVVNTEIIGKEKATFEMNWDDE